MAELNEEFLCAFPSTAITVTTAVNGDKIIIKGIHLSPEEAATLAWLVNTHDANLQIELRIEP